jgi:hypothetical protein
VEICSVLLESTRWPVIYEAMSQIVFDLLNFFTSVLISIHGKVKFAVRTEYTSILEKVLVEKYQPIFLSHANKDFQRGDSSRIWHVSDIF